MKENNVRIGIYPGSFDPITLGHLDVIERGAKMFDKLYVAIAVNVRKKYTFSEEERLDMLKDACKHIKNVEVVSCHEDLTVEFARKMNATAILRGLRAMMDFEYELQMASTNYELNDNIETIFLMTNTKYSYLSSSVVKEVAMGHGDISKFVTPYTSNKLHKKYNY